MKLNGWQRLWVFASVSFGCFIFVATLKELPSEKRLIEEYESVIPSITLQKMESERLHELKIPELYPDAKRSPVTQADVRQAKAEKMAKLQSKLNQLPDRRANVAFKGVIAWTAFSVGLYLIGWFIAWIIRGFKADKAAKTKS